MLLESGVTGGKRLSHGCYMSVRKDTMQRGDFHRNFLKRGGAWVLQLPYTPSFISMRNKCNKNIAPEKNNY